MSKQRKPSNAGRTQADAIAARLKVFQIQDQATSMLEGLRTAAISISDVEKIAAEEMNAIVERYKVMLDPLRKQKEAVEKELLTLMKKNKAVLFDGTDVVNLPPGSLIRNKKDHVSIPKTALAECEVQHFDDVIKVVKSLDREAIEKWPDAKLVLIGAERKPKEEFSYNIKNTGEK